MIRLFTSNPYRELERALGYRFRSKARLKAALVHRSYRFENGADTGVDNQRLEFLGDAVLGLVAAAHLFRQLPDGDEGVLTAARSRLTSGTALAQVAQRLGLGDWLLLGKGEDHSGGRTRSSNLADAMEAILGAAYLDGGLAAVETIFASRFAPSEKAGAPDAGDNPKGRLQQVCQMRWKRSPQYGVQSETGPRHARRFTVSVQLGARRLGTGDGASKREAEAAAARDALTRLVPAGQRASATPGGEA